MKRILSLAAALMLLAGCEPEYADSPAQAAEAHHEEVAGADPTAISGRVKDSTENTIHHPRADGNAGRPDDGPGAPSLRAGPDLHAAPPPDSQSEH